MKLNHLQLESHLNKQQLAPLYLLSSEEILLKMDTIHSLRQAATNAGHHLNQRFVQESNTDWEHLHSLIYTNDLFATKQYIEIDFRDATPNKAALALLTTYAENPPAQNILVLSIGKLDSKTEKAAWYKILEQAGIIIQIWPIAREQLPAWLKQRAHKNQLQLDTEAAQFLADYVEGNLVAAAQTIEKICLFKPEGRINTALLQAILWDESHFTVFDLVEQLLAGNTARLLHILESLKYAGTEPTLILWAITRELRLSFAIAKELNQGQNFATLCQKYRIFSRRQPALKRFLQRFNTEATLKHLSQAMQIDKIIKGIENADVWSALQLFCLRMV